MPRAVEGVVAGRQDAILRVDRCLTLVEEGFAIVLALLSKRIVHEVVAIQVAIWACLLHKAKIPWSGLWVAGCLDVADARCVAVQVLLWLGH